MLPCGTGSGGVASGGPGTVGVPDTLTDAPGTAAAWIACSGIANATAKAVANATPNAIRTARSKNAAREISRCDRRA